jgi:hypothetical protein
MESGCGVAPIDANPGFRAVTARWTAVVGAY